MSLYCIPVVLKKTNQCFFQLGPPSWTCFAFIVLIPFMASAYTDGSHYSNTFEETRHFRVFTPLDYGLTDHAKRYPVLYYFHGCGGSYRRSGPYRYTEYGLQPPELVDRATQEDYEYANNIDFENLATSKQLIIIAIDGKIKHLPPGCQVYFPTLAEEWKGNYYNFSLYIRELIPIVDERYRTLVGPSFRAISGLSMGGHMAVWVAATNPHLFSSASQFCYGPSYYRVGDPIYQTTVEIKELWRNFRGLPLRHATTDRDYLKYYSSELFSTFKGAGFDNIYFQANYCHHAAARMDLQIDFHLEHFGATRDGIPCFSYVNLYPDFEVWGYEVRSNKTGDGWTYLHNVTKNGLGIYSRKKLPYGGSLPNYDLTLVTPAHYRANDVYRLARYQYRDGAITQEEIVADSMGRLVISSRVGMGEEVGILDDSFEPPIFVLVDTLNESIYLDAGMEQSLAFDLLNLSDEVQEVKFEVSSSDTNLIQVITQPEPILIPAFSTMRVDSLITCRSLMSPSAVNTCYLTITPILAGRNQNRSRIIQVKVKDKRIWSQGSMIEVFDGKSKSLSLFKYAWNGWDTPLSTGHIEEGTGNGNGVPEVGEEFSVWIRMDRGLDSTDQLTWHPAMPINRAPNNDVVLASTRQHRFSTGRSLLSGQMKLTRNPTMDRPIRIPIQVELLGVAPLHDDCHRNAADDFDFYYGDLILSSDGSLEFDMK